MVRVTGNFTSQSPLHPAAIALLNEAFSQGWADPAKIGDHSARTAILRNEAIDSIAQNLKLEPSEIEVIGEKTEIEIKLDKTVYNIGKDLTLKGSSVSDVLDNLPSIEVDIEGNVSLRGNQSVRILINGKPSGLVGISSNEALKQFPSESVEKVEVIT